MMEKSTVPTFILDSDWDLAAVWLFLFQKSGAGIS